MKYIPLTHGKFALVDDDDYEVEAAKVYNEKAKELFGEFARLNEV